MGKCICPPKVLTITYHLWYKPSGHVEYTIQRNTWRAPDDWAKSLAEAIDYRLVEVLDKLKYYEGVAATLSTAKVNEVDLPLPQWMTLRNMRHNVNTLTKELDALIDRRIRKWRE